MIRYKNYKTVIYMYFILFLKHWSQGGAEYLFHKTETYHLSFYFHLPPETDKYSA